MHVFRIAAGLAGLTGVTLGALGAHGLAGHLAAHGTASAWEKAVLYQLIHGLALMVLSRDAARGDPWTRRAGFCWIAGIVLFSGSLYALALGGPRWLGPVTPLGGVAFIAGWLCWLVGGRRGA